MATKRVLKHSINWADLAGRVPEHQRHLYQAFKAKSDGYLRRVMELPEKTPEINWAHYKSKVPVAGMVDEFQKRYSALSIPYPIDTVTPQVDAQEAEARKIVDEYILRSNDRIKEYKQQLARLAALIPYEEMTMEDYRDLFPEDALDPINKPTFWPHDEEEQLGHVSKNPEPAGH